MLKGRGGWQKSCLLNILHGYRIAMGLTPEVFERNAIRQNSPLEGGRVWPVRLRGCVKSLITHPYTPLESNSP